MSGAGDTVIATLAAMLAAAPPEALVLYGDALEAFKKTSEHAAKNAADPMDVARAVEPFQFCIMITSPEAMRSTVLSELYIFKNGFCFCSSSISGLVNSVQNKDVGILGLAGFDDEVAAGAAAAAAFSTSARRELRG